MKKTMKVTGIVIGVIVLIITGLVTYVKTMLPNVGDAPNITVDATPANIERGNYLANHVMICMDCHSQRDWSSFSGPMVAGTQGRGGEIFDQTMGFPGTFVAPNITPKSLSSWTDGEIFRAITTGVSKDGRALFSIMPHHNFGQLDEKDILSIIAYLRTIPAIDYAPNPSKADFPMNIILNTIPQKANLQPIPPKTDLAAYGKYLVTAASCNDCHTKQENGKFIGEPFAGGFEFLLPGNSLLTTPNITPHATGIGNWTQDYFVQRFKAYTHEGYENKKVAPGEFQTLMPWTMYSGMTEEDLTAIYTYLRTLKPVDNRIEKFSKLPVLSSK